jgi:MFS transporter, PAT family, beta-lactamase induction signal transducer AmpG
LFIRNSLDMKIDLSPYLQVFRSGRIATVTVLGLSSGLPLALTGGTLQAWMTVQGVDIATIGIFGLASLPYTLKFLWSPLMDRFSLPLMGRRRGWILTTQIAVAGAIAAMASTSPAETPLLLAACALLVAFLSASQDIVIDAYRTDVLKENERGVGAAVFVFGYRIAMLISGALALVVSEILGWPHTYLLMAAFMMIGISATILGPEPERQETPPRSLQEAVVGPLRDYFTRHAAVPMLLLIILYKLGDAYAGTLTTAFLIRGVGFSPAEVGAINKGLGLLSVILGALAGGTLMIRLGLFRSLVVFGLLQAVSNLSFTVLALLGKNYGMLIFTVAFENLSGGMGTAAFVSLLMSMCSARYSATQFALLSSLAALGRVFVSPTSGYLAESLGWPLFFLLTAAAALPGLLLLWKLQNEVSRSRTAGG